MCLFKLSVMSYRTWFSSGMHVDMACGTYLLHAYGNGKVVRVARVVACEF